LAIDEEQMIRSFHPLGWKAVVVLLLMLAASARAAPAPKPTTASVRHSVGIGCVSVPRGWEVAVEEHPGWASGQIRGTAGSRIMAFTIGTGLAAASPERREQFQWFRTEKLGDSVLNYALEKKEDGRGVLQASVIHGSSNANFITPERDPQSLPDLLAVARSYSREKCPQ
jgi:hypothetical protein